MRYARLDAAYYTAGVDPVITRILAHAERIASGGVPATSAARAKAFIADTLAVGASGVLTPWQPQVLEAAAGGGPEATVWGTAVRLPLAQAAMVNGFQIHGQEFDCVHEGAVVHPMAAILPSLIGWAEGAGNVSGERLLRAVVLAVDVAATLGLCSRAPMRFFRPANAGGFGATVGLGFLAGLDAGAMANALGIYYGQCAGTMQAHVEASPQLAMQVGFAARAAVTAVELARRGMPGPQHSLSGPFGYFALFDGKADPAPFDALGQAWRVEELSYKPFPSGRATHGGLDGLTRLMRQAPIDRAQIAAVTFNVPPLTARLVGRPLNDAMSVTHARLCLPYVGAILLRYGEVGLEHFSEAQRRDPTTLALARRLTVAADSNPDPNALSPQRVELRFNDGSTRTVAVEHVFGSPGNMLTPDQAHAKFDACWRAVGVTGEAPQRLWQAVARLETLLDAGELARLATIRT
jgi:2-methylcitrate dehydratase PrpD